jgi:hypothetical protein
LRITPAMEVNHGTRLDDPRAVRPRDPRIHRTLKQFIAMIAAVALASGALMAQTIDPVVTRVRITHDGYRIAGRLMKVDRDAVTLVRDGTDDPVRIPLSSISAAEVSEGKRSRAVAVLTGIGVGFGAMEATGLSACNIGDGGCATVALLIGIASGIAIARLIGHERWRRVPITSLPSTASMTP